jgi:transcriptional regulator with XRE-family HTH domain
MFPEKVEITTIIKEARKARNMTQESLGGMAKVTKQAISKIESGECVPDEYTLLGICRVLKLDFDSLLYSSHPEKWAENKVKSYLNSKRKYLKRYDNIVQDIVLEYLLHLIKNNKW